MPHEQAVPVDQDFGEEPEFRLKVLREYLLERVLAYRLPVIAQDFVAAAWRVGEHRGVLNPAGSEKLVEQFRGVQRAVGREFFRGSHGSRGSRVSHVFHVFHGSHGSRSSRGPRGSLGPRCFDQAGAGRKNAHRITQGLAVELNSLVRERLRARRQRGCKRGRRQQEPDNPRLPQGAHN